jgi:cytochrome c5
LLASFYAARGAGTKRLFNNNSRLIAAARLSHTQAAFQAAANAQHSVRICNYRNIGMRRIYSVLLGLATLAMTTSAIAGGHSVASRFGEEVFETHCANCHSGGFGGFFSGAPDIDDPDDWKDLTPKGIDGLTATTISGIGEMAARGGCMECTDAEIRAAIEHILQQVQ